MYTIRHNTTRLLTFFVHYRRTYTRVLANYDLLDEFMNVRNLSSETGK